MCLPRSPRRILLLLRHITPEGKWTTNSGDASVLPGRKRAFQTWNGEYRSAIPGVRYTFVAMWYFHEAEQPGAQGGG